MKFGIDISHSEIESLIRNHLKEKHGVKVTRYDPSTGYSRAIPVNFSVIVDKEVYDNVKIKAEFSCES